MLKKSSLSTVPEELALKKRVHGASRKYSLSFPRPMILSFVFPLFLPFVGSTTGAGNVGFPVPRFAFASSVAAATDAWDC